MANVKISDLTAATAASGTQQFEVNDSGASKRVTGAQVSAYVRSQIASSDVSGAGGLLAANNLSDLANAGAARSNLGIDTTYLLTQIKTVDGSGSGLDADLLDGNHASAFYSATNPSGYISGNQTITLSGDLSGSGTTSINAQIAANVVGANELNVTGNGTAGQVLSSDADGSFTWINVGGGAVTDYNVVGSWIIAYNNTTAQMYAGTAYSGSSIGYVNSSAAIPVSASTDSGVATLSGTWRCMMRVRGTTQSRSITTKYASLFVRVT